MSEIRIIEKDDSITFEQIHDILYAAHARNREDGLNVHTADLSGEEIKEKIGPNGKCFVALDGDKLVGVLAAKIIERNTWYAHGPVAYSMLTGVIPEYRGQRILSKLSLKLADFVKENNINRIEYRTASGNDTMKRIGERWGFKRVDFRSYAGEDHYTIVYFQWLDGDAPSALTCKLRYHYSKMRTIIKYKPGKIPRFKRSK